MAGEAKGADVRLPHVVAIGFTGHRKLPDEAQSRDVLLRVLAQELAVADRVVVGVSSVAAGADLLFAESCLALGIPLRVLLPLPREEFRKDFDAADWNRAERVMEQALSVDVPAAAVTGETGSREEAYYVCGLETVQQSQMLMGLWDGEPARGLGGTGDMIPFAQKMNRAVTWIDSRTGEVRMLAPPQHLPDIQKAELQFLNALPPTDATSGSRNVAQAWLAKLDANATLVAPQVRRMAAVPIVCTALAAWVSGAAQKGHGSGAWIGLVAGLGLVAALLPWALRLGKRQARWVRIRTAAEITRSVVALWETPFAYESLGPEILPELSAMVRSLNFLKACQRGGGSVPEFKARYGEERVIDQRNYFLRQSTKAAAKGRRYRLIGKVSSVGAIAISLWAFAGPRLVKAGTPVWLPLVASALFQVATVVGALVVVHDCDRRERRYDELHRTLEQWQVELEAFRTWRPVMEVVAKVERALLVELLEWRALLQHRKMPRN